jgi:uncharacterized membrane protein
MASKGVAWSVQITQANSLPVGKPRRYRVGSFSGAETHARSILKAVSWRTLGTLDTFAISWYLTGKLELAGLIAGLEFVTKIGWYYFHERVWAAVAWGRR